MTGAPPHDEDRCERVYAASKAASVRFAAALLASSGRNRYLSVFDAEELYDAAWETYYRRREYMEDRDDHVAYLNALILSRFRDERRRSRALKRTPPGREVELDDTGPGAPRAVDAHSRVDDRDLLRRLLAQVRNPDDARALVDHEVLGLSFEEIGAIEGITAEAARRRALRAKEQAQPREAAPTRGASDDPPR